MFGDRRHGAWSMGQKKIKDKGKKTKVKKGKIRKSDDARRKTQGKLNLRAKKLEEANCDLHF